MIYVLQDKGNRTYQEDTYVIEDKYCGVFDGHGGDEVSKYLSKNIVKIIENYRKKTNDIERAIFNSFKYVQENINYDSGSTALLLIKIDKYIYYIVNIGDSRAVINNGFTGVNITKDHKPNDPIEYKKITEKGGMVTKLNGDVHRVNNMLALSRAVGDKFLQKYITWIPDIYKIYLTKKNKFIILATDGIWDVMNANDVINLLEDDIKSSCQKILKQARLRGSEDNITIIIIKI